MTYDMSKNEIQSYIWDILEFDKHWGFKYPALVDCVNLDEKMAMALLQKDVERDSNFFVCVGNDNAYPITVSQYYANEVVYHWNKFSTINLIEACVFSWREHHRK